MTAMNHHGPMMHLWSEKFQEQLLSDDFVQDAMASAQYAADNSISCQFEMGARHQHRSYVDPNDGTTHDSWSEYSYPHPPQSWLLRKEWYSQVGDTRSAWPLAWLLKLTYQRS